MRNPTPFNYHLLCCLSCPRVYKWHSRPFLVLEIGMAKAFLVSQCSLIPNCLFCVDGAVVLLLNHVKSPISGYGSESLLAFITIPVGI